MNVVAILIGFGGGLTGKCSLPTTKPTKEDPLQGSVNPSSANLNNPSGHRSPDGLHFNIFYFLSQPGVEPYYA